jgi:hypothetical protein
MFSCFMVSSKIKFSCVLESSMTRIPFPLALVFRTIYPWPPVAAICLVGARASKTSCLVILSSYSR